MATLPTVGSSKGTWGAELNEWLLVAHNADGTISESANTINRLYDNGDVNYMTVETGAANRLLTLGADVSLNQDLQTTDSITFDDITVSNPSNIYSLNHDSFSGFVANEHINHTSVTLTAGTGLTGGGDISASRTFAVDGLLEDLDTLGASASDGQFIVATGEGTLAWESGATARTSLGLTIGTDVQAHGDVLDDLNILGAVGGDNEVLIGTGAGVLAWESGATLRTSIGLGTGDTVQFANYTATNLLTACATNAGALDFSAESKTLTVEDNAVVSQDYSSDADVTFNDITVSTPSNIYALSHDSFTDYDANKHVDHTGVTLTAGTGLTGGGDISSNRTFAVDGVLEDLDTLGAAGSDGEFIVATGAGVLAWESGATARASLGLTIGTHVQAHGDVLDDFNTLGAAGSDGQFIVATGAGVFAYESGATARTSIGLGTGDTVQFANFEASNKLTACATNAGALDFSAASKTLTVSDDATVSGTNTGDQASIVGITGTKAEFNTACTDGTFMYVGDAPTAHTHDGDTLQHDGVNSDGGAFSFNTTGTVTFNQSIAAANYTATNLLTACATNAGALDFSAGSKTLTVEDDAIVSQDYSSDASPTFAGLDLTGITDGNVPYVSAAGFADSPISTDGTSIGINEVAPVTLLELTSTAPYITLHNSTEENGDGGRESRLIARGEQDGSEETILGYLEFAHDGTSDDEKGKFNIVLNDGNDGTSPSITPLSVGSDGLTTLTALDIASGGYISGGGWFDVREYGAVGDGSNDDTSEIQAAIDAAEAAGGGTVFFPPGNYKISSALSNDDVGVFIKGASRYSTIITQSDTGGANCLTVDASGDVNHQFRSGIADISLVGNSSSGVGLVLTNGYEYSIERITVRGHGGNGIDIGGYIYYCTLKDVEVWDNDGHGVRLYNTGGNSPHNNSAWNLQCISNGDAGLYIQEAFDFVIYGGSFQGNNDYGIEGVAAHSVKVYGGWFESNSTAGIYCPTTSYGCRFEPSYMLDGALVYGSNTLIYDNRNGAYGDHYESTLSNHMSASIVANQPLPYGNQLVMPAVQGTLSGSASIETDTRSMLNGKCVKLTAQDDYVLFFSGAAYNDCPSVLRPGLYKIGVYAKSSAGNATNLNIIAGQTTNTDGQLDKDLTIGTGNEFKLCSAGVWDVTDTNFNGRAIEIKLSKDNDDVDDIYISHVVVEPLGPVVVSGGHGSAGHLDIFEDLDNGINIVRLQPPSSMVSNYVSVNGTLVLDDGANWRVTQVFKAGVCVSVTTAASSGATATWTAD